MRKHLKDILVRCVIFQSLSDQKEENERRTENAIERKTQKYAQYFTSLKPTTACLLQEINLIIYKLVSLWSKCAYYFTTHTLKRLTFFFIFFFPLFFLKNSLNIPVDAGLLALKHILTGYVIYIH